MRASLILAALLATSASAQMTPTPAMGRLFLTPTERQQLDLLRDKPGAPAVLEAAPAPLVQAAPPPPEPVTVNGIVRRSSGKATVWLNQVPQDGGASPSGAYALQLPAGGSVLVKPGQSVDPVSGVLKDADAPR